MRTPAAELDRERAGLAAALAQRTERDWRVAPPDGQARARSDAAPADCDPVERLAVEPAAGGGSHIDTEQGVDWVWFRRPWLRKHGLVASRCRVLGDSMEPTLMDRSSILVNTNQRQRRRGRIFVVRTNDGLVVKRAGRGDREQWTLVSDNPDKEAWPTLGWPDGAKIVGEVMWVARTL